MNQNTPDREPEEHSFAWAEHPDSYPDLSHCPSCGEAVEVPWTGGHVTILPDPVRCERCGRDLRLPRRAVKDQLCLLCKVPADDADESVTYLRLETGERLCSNCAADLRAFKYELTAQHFVAEYISEGHRQAIIEALSQVAEEYEGEYTFTVNANAKYGRLEPEPDEDLTVEDVMRAADADPEELRDDLPPELREKIEVADEDEDSDADESDEDGDGAGA